MADDISVRLPETGDVIHFPLGTDETTISSALGQLRVQKLGASGTDKFQPGAFQTRPGGLVYNAAQVQGPTHFEQQRAEGVGAKIRRGALLGAASGAGIPETQTPIRSLAQGLSQQPTLAQTLDPSGGALSQVPGIVKGLFGAGKESISGDPETMAHGIASGITQVAALRQLGKTERVALEYVQDIKPKLQAAIEDRSSAVASHFQDVAQNVHDSAQAKFQDIAAAVAQKNPAGIPKGPIRQAIRDRFGDLVQTDETAPASLRALMTSELEHATVFKGTASRAPSGSVREALQSRFAQDMSPEVRKQLMDLANEDNPIALKNIGETWQFEELQQLRSKLAQDAFGRSSMSGPMRSVAKSAYAEVSEALKAEAQKAGKFGDWIRANEEWSNYVRDFATRSSLPYKVANASRASEGLAVAASDTKAEPLRRQMAKYEEYGYQPEAVEQEARWYAAARSAMEKSKISKFDQSLIVGGAAGALIHPGAGAGALAYGAGRIIYPRLRMAQLAARKAVPIRVGAMKQMLSGQR